MTEGDPTILSLVLARLDTTERNTVERLAATERALSQRLDRQDADLKEIKAQTQRTNGRVTVLEKARERAQGMIFAYSWIPSTLSAVLGAGLTILVMALTGTIH